MYIPTKYGRILYVSKEGNNSSAEVGNISRPWETPQDARDAASDGDLIYVFPGTYTYGNATSGADYEGLNTGGTYETNQEVALNYGKTDISYHFEPGVLMQGIGGAAGDPRSLLYEPREVLTEAPSTVKITGHLDHTTTDLVAFINMKYRDSDWYVEFNEVTNCRFGVYMSTNWGQEAVARPEKLVVRGHKLSSKEDSIRLGTSSSSPVSQGRIGLSKGYVDIEINETYAAPSPEGRNRVDFIWNYDVFIKVKKMECQDMFISALYQTLCHVEIDEFIANGGFQSIGHLSPMDESEIHLNIGRVTNKTADNGGDIRIENYRGTGGKVFINIDYLESDNPSSAAIHVYQSAAVYSRITGHGLTGWDGETVVTVSGNYEQLNVAQPVVDTTGTSLATGAAGNVLLNLKNCKLIGAGTNSIAATVGANTDYLIQGSYANLPVHANVDEVGQAVIVDSNYK